MTDYSRLIITVPLNHNQSAAVATLMDRDGLCTCGRYLKRTDAKLCLAQVNTGYFGDARMRNTLVIAAYCFACASSINLVLKSLKGQFRNPEPDQARHEKGQ